MLSYSSPATTAAEVTAYAEARLRAWPGAVQEQEAAILRAQSWMASAYNLRWMVQFDNEDAPLLVKYALAEAAIMEAASPGVLLTRAGIESQPKVLTRVESISWAPQERKDWHSSAIRVPHIEEMLAPLIRRPFQAAAVVV